jgi:hypothetical protein
MAGPWLPSRPWSALLQVSTLISDPHHVLEPDPVNTSTDADHTMCVPRWVLSRRVFKRCVAALCIWGWGATPTALGGTSYAKHPSYTIREMLLKRNLLCFGVGLREWIFMKNDCGVWYGC